MLQEQNSTDNAIQEHCQNIQEIPVDSHRSHDDGKSTLQKRRVDRRQYFCARFHSRLLSRTHARTHDTSYNTPSMSLFEKKKKSRFSPMSRHARSAGHAVTSSASRFFIHTTRLGDTSVHMHIHIQTFKRGGGDSSVVRAPDS